MRVIHEFKIRVKDNYFLDCELIETPTGFSLNLVSCTIKLNSMDLVCVDSSDNDLSLVMMSNLSSSSPHCWFNTDPYSAKLIKNLHHDMHYNF